MVTEAGPWASRRTLVEVLAQTLGLSAVFTPVVGAAVRWLAFLRDGSIPDPLRAAIEAPLPELIATAILTLIAGMAIVLIVAVSVFVVAPLQGFAVGPWFSSGKRARRGRASVALFFVLFGTAVVLENSLPEAIGFVGALGTAWLISWAATQAGRLSFVSVVSATTVLLVSAVLTGGLALRLPAAQYTIDPASGVQSAEYVQLGTDDGFLLLRACSDGSIVDWLIQPVRREAARRPKIYETLSRGASQRLSLEYLC
jgi:hypothetical protein